MTISFKTFSSNLSEKLANSAQFEPADVSGLAPYESRFGGVSFGAAGWGPNNSNPKENPMYKYFNSNMNQARNKTQDTIGLLKATPGLLSTNLDGEGGEDEGTQGGRGGGFSSFFTTGGKDNSDGGGDGQQGDQTTTSPPQTGGSTTSGLRGHGSAVGGGEEDEDDEDDDTEEGENAPPVIPGMNTDALYFGGDGDYDTIKAIHLSALSHQKHAQARWQHLKQWVNSFGVDPKTQTKIADTKAVLGINAPAYIKHLNKVKEQVDLEEDKHANASTPAVPTPIPAKASSPAFGIRYMSDIADFSTWEHPEKDKHIEDHPMVKYFMGNIDAAKANIDNIVNNYMKNTPGQEVVRIDGEENKGIGKHGRLPNANTHNLHYGNVGHADERNEVDAIYKKALAAQKPAQIRWKTLRNWMNSMTTDPAVAAKIADVNAVLGVNTPAVMRDQESSKRSKG